MNNQQSGGEAIRLTNRTARALREQARQQQFALHVAATVITLLLAVAAVLLGMRHLIAVPLTVLAAIAIDALLILLARGRYLSLTGQAICTEAAARQMRGQSAEEIRMQTAQRDLQRIKEDLGLGRDEEDEDLRAPQKKTASHVETVHTDGDTRAVPPAARRRRQARLQVLTSDEPADQAK